MTQYGITAFGAYVPRLRLDRAAIAAAHRWMAPSLKGLAKGERAFCSWDEDAITMAVEAARNCLAESDRAEVSAISLASTSFPYADLQNSVIAAGALSLGESITSIDLAGSQRVGVSGLAQALRSGRTSSLFIASDRLQAKPASPQEMTYGAGAAAFRLGSSEIIARMLGSAALAAPFIDHVRAADAAYDYFWEERWIRDEGYGKIIPAVVSAALADCGLTIEQITWLVVGVPVKGAVAGIAKQLKFSGTLADTLESQVGYCGTAHPLLMLTDVLERAKPGERLLMVGFGQGAEAVILETTEAIGGFKPKRTLAETIQDRIVTSDYLRLLSLYGAINLDWGMRAEGAGKAALTTAYREADQLSAFIAGKCGTCGTVQFPQLAYCVNPECQAPAHQFSRFPLPDQKARVLTFTADWLSFHPAPPLYVGFVQFDAGCRLLMETVDVGPDGIDVDTQLRIVFRIKETDKTRGFKRYFWKATPVAKGE
jgi:3-hydroxy-3-methylglutaryl CoA synthase